jgi:hypothetical protein
MIANVLRRICELTRAPWFTPAHFVKVAFVIAFIFALAHACGLRQFTSILNGTVGSLELGWTMSAALGVFYVLCWLAFVLFVPVLLMAAALLPIIEKWLAHPAMAPAQSTRRGTLERRAGEVTRWVPK